MLVVGGGFAAAGSVAAANIALFDPVTNQWEALGTGTGAAVLALAVQGTDLIVGGAFTTAGGITVNKVARWNGTGWSSLSTGTNGWVHALAVLGNGDVVAGGTFNSAGGGPANFVARFDGTSWSPLGSGVVPLGSGAAPFVACLLTMPNGDLIVGGHFSHAGTGAASCIARWDGNNWSVLGSGIVPLPGFSLSPTVGALALLPNGDLVVGGRFDTAGGIPATNVAKWDGIAWSAFGNGVAGVVKVVATSPNGEVFAGGDGNTVLRRWTGTSWAHMGLVTIGSNVLLGDASGSLVLGGYFATLGSNVARWSGGVWSQFGVASPNGAPGGQLAVGERANGDIAVGGVNGIVAIWNGITWNWIGGTLVPPFMVPLAQVNAVAGLTNGEIVVGGMFSSAGAAATNAIARWNGNWQSIGGGAAGANAMVAALRPLAGGGVLAGGLFASMGGVPTANIARWNGTTWSGFGSGISGVVKAVLELPNGDVVAGGLFATAGGVAASNVARWNGSSWQALGAGVSDEVLALTALANGDVIAGGHFDFAGGAPASRIARWDGSAWSPLGSGMGTTSPGFTHYDVTALATLPNNDVLAGVDVAGGTAVGYITRWNGSAWSVVDGGFGAGATRALALRRNGDVVAVGAFQTAGGAASPNLAILRSSCPASAQVQGAGCAGSGGPNTLVADTLPWTGSTLRTTAAGMPAMGLAVVVHGFAAASLPLVTVLPAALPGCDLLVTPAILEARVLAGPSLAMALALPNSAALAGITLFDQVCALGIDPQGMITEVTATNALLFTIGTF